MQCPACNGETQRQSQYSIHDHKCTACGLVFDVVKLVSFGRGGDTVHYGRHKRSTGYGSPERPHAADPADPHKHFPDGCPALDIREAVETDEGFRYVFRGPMVDVDLDPGQVDRCPEPSPMFAAAVAGNQFGTLLALQAVHKGTEAAKPGPLDSVDVQTHLEAWRALGARVGHYEGGEIVWD